MTQNARKLFLIGLIGAAVTMIGDLLIGANPSTVEMTGSMMVICLYMRPKIPTCVWSWAVCLVRLGSPLPE